MKKWDIFIIAIVVIFSIVSTVYIYASETKNTDHISISIKGEIVKKIPFSENQFKKHSFKFGQHIGQIEIKNGKVRMVPMTKDICPLSICSDTGWIEKSYENIVCLPNKIIITIETSDN